MSVENIELFGNRIIVKQKVVKRVGQIWIPQKGVANSLEKYEGIVMVVGDEVELPLKPGDYIAYAKYSGHQLDDKDLRDEDDDSEVYIMSASDILYKKNTSDEGAQEVK